MKTKLLLFTFLLLGSFTIRAMGDAERWEEDKKLKLPAQTMFTAGQQILPHLSKNMHIVSRVSFNYEGSFKAEGRILVDDKESGTSFELIITELPIAKSAPNEVKYEATYRVIPPGSAQ